MHMKAQTGLEYLIILAAIITIASVSVYLVSGNSKGNSQSVIFRSCQEAASQCAMMKMANPSAACSLCDSQCVDTDTGFDIITGMPRSDTAGAVSCCKKGSVADIYSGSEGNCAAASTTCDGITPYGQCASTNPKYCFNNGTIGDNCNQCGCTSGKCNSTSNSCV
jgi:uncharacterized protein (UPF0333 family)